MNDLKDVRDGQDRDLALGWWIIGLICIGVATFFAGILSLKQLGLIGDNLPGCGPASACAEVTGGPFGQIPGLDWPVSFVGLAWFSGLLIAWLFTRSGLSSGLRWIVRLGALGSIGFTMLMVAKGTICPYCLAAHMGNFGFWIVVELTPRSAHRTNAMVGGVVTFMLATMVLAGAQITRSSIQAEEAVQNEQQFIDQVLATQESTNPKAKPNATDVVDDSGEPTDVDPKTPEVGTSSLLQARWTEGSPDAPVQVVMFSDYQCPDCRRYETEMQRILERRDDVSLSVRHFPMCADCNPHLKKTIHENACWAARSAETAGMLGGESAFWEMHQWLFENKGMFKDGRLPSMLRDELGFDMQEFTELMISDETLERVQGDIEDAVTLGIFYTPMIFVNGVELKWHMLPVSLTSTVDTVADAIAEGQAISDQSMPPVGLEKFVADWRDGRQKNINESTRTFRRSGVDDDATEIIAFIDFVSPNSAVFLSDLRAWESEHGPSNLILRFNPLNHDCNPNLPERIQSREGSCLGARAAKTAGLIGGDDAAFDMAFWLIDHGPELGSMSDADVIAHAESMGMDADAFATTLNSINVKTLIDQDIAEFKRNRFPHLPAVIVDGRQIPRLTMEKESVVAAVLEEVASNRE